MLPSIIAVHIYSRCTHRDDGGAASYSSRMSAFIECWMWGPVHSLAFALKPLSDVYMHKQLALRRTHASVQCLASKDLCVCLFYLCTCTLVLTHKREYRFFQFWMWFDRVSSGNCQCVFGDKVCCMCEQADVEILLLSRFGFVRFLVNTLISMLFQRLFCCIHTWGLLNNQTIEPWQKVNKQMCKRGLV